MIPRHVCNRFNLHDDIWEILDIFDRYSTRFGLVSVALFETIAVAWVFKLENFENDIEKMIHSKPGFYWEII
ncbi:sodium-dependent dopamine transporter-like isoform X2 [Styela clava]